MTFRMTVDKLIALVFKLFNHCPLLNDTCLPHSWTHAVRSPPNRIHCQNYECDDRKLSLLCFNLNEFVFSIF